MAWPTTSNPKTEHVPTRFPPNEVGDLDAERALHDMSRGAFIRWCVRRCIKADRAKRAREKEGHE